MGQGTGQNLSKGSPERSSLVFTFLPMALVLAVGASGYVLAATGPDASSGVPLLLTLGLAVAFGAAMSKVRGLLMSVVLAAAVLVGGLTGQGDVSRQFDDGGSLLVVIAAALTIFVLAFWLLGVVIGSVWRWARRRWST